MTSASITIRISPAFAGDWEARCPEETPEAVQVAGQHRVSPEVARAVLADAEHNSDRGAFDVGPYGMPLGTFNAYRALAKQVRKALGASRAAVAESVAQADSHLVEAGLPRYGELVAFPRCECGRSEHAEAMELLRQLDEVPGTGR